MASGVAVNSRSGCGVGEFWIGVVGSIAVPGAPLPAQPAAKNDNARVDNPNASHRIIEEFFDRVLFILNTQDDTKGKELDRIQYSACGDN